MTGVSRKTFKHLISKLCEYTWQYHEEGSTPSEPIKNDMHLCGGLKFDIVFYSKCDTVIVFDAYDIYSVSVQASDR